MTLLELRNISKSFGGVAALRNVSLRLNKGEIVGLLGENGAGKSTLLKILSGAQRQDAGEILLDGAAYTARTPHDAQTLGVITIYQELSLIGTLSVAENVFVGRAPRTKAGLVDWRRMRELSREIIGRVGITLDPDSLVSDLSVAEQQMVEIARALSMQSRVIIMDEPTSALTETEVERLLTIMSNLRDAGVSILFVTHRLKEAAQICDRVCVLRDGQQAGELGGDQERILVPQIIERMVGRSASELYARPAAHTHAPGSPVLVVKSISTSKRPDALHSIVLSDVSLTISAGEIVGIAGLVGSGRSELARVIFGADQASAGTMLLKGRPYAPSSPLDAIDAGIGLVPEDRKHQAIFPMLSIRSNFSVASLRQFANGFGVISRSREIKAINDFRKQLSIRMNSTEQPIDGLSGGNQQKVILARWLARKPALLIVDEPTRGVDVGAKTEVHHILVSLAEAGVAILMISSELPEILSVSDRIIAMRNGRVTGELVAAGATEHEVIRLMTLEPAFESSP